MVQKQFTPRAWAEIGLLSLIWGGVFVATRIALDEIGPLTAVFLRVSIAAAVLWIVVRLRAVPVPPLKAVALPVLGMGVLNNVIPFTLMAWAQLHIPSGLTSIFNASTALFGVIAAAIAFADEKLTLRKIAGVGIGFAGVVLAIGGGALDGFDLTQVAQIAVVAGTVSYALAGVWARKTLAGVAPLVAAAGMLTASSLIMAPVALAVEGWPDLALDLRTWAAIVYYAVIATAGAYLLYFRVLAVAGSGNLMLVTLLIPPVAILLGAWLRAEALDSHAYAGFATLALGLAVLDGRIFKAFRTRV